MMYSSAVLSNLYKGVFFAVVLLVGASVEELLPKAYGVGVPILMVAALCLVRSRQFLPGALLALAAGAVEDAVSSLPPMTSASFFLIAAMTIRYVDGYLSVPLAVSATLAYPLYQVWLAIWSVSFEGAVFLRVLIAIPFGMIAATAVAWLVNWMARKAAVDDQV